MYFIRAIKSPVRRAGSLPRVDGPPEGTGGLRTEGGAGDPGCCLCRQEAVVPGGGLGGWSPPPPLLSMETVFVCLPSQNSGSFFVLASEHQIKRGC